MLAYRFLVAAKQPLERAVSTLRQTDPDADVLAKLNDLLRLLDETIKLFEETYGIE